MTALPSEATPDRVPYVLVADDDAASRRFLSDGLHSLGARVKACGDGAAVLELARGEAFDLLLLDLRMPGGGARALLHALRGDARAASGDSVAVATSAELSPDDRRQLLAEGFGDVLAKPCDLGALQRVLNLARHEAQRQDLPVLDDAAALVATGDTGTMQALRGLLREELLALERDLGRDGNDAGTLIDRLHRLRSSCGFCGASALAAQAARLQRDLRGEPRDAGAAVQRFRRALRATLAALDHPAGLGLQDA
ncbi:response regulator [Fulvimonas soli]|uniref:Hpt domain-containing protein n=1 Tax=Fulvimonas soli TaxID=155197 RepID=A0A316IKK3_9GAMM|nr:response regulator [Fulvimonas soli]PWK93044.1 Hpt domain-containing protein [Fulvimonas soli]